MRLQREGYELKRGKYISARAPGQERFTRLKTLGADYAEDALTARMAGRARPSRQPKHQSGKISLLIDIQNNIKAQQSAGYRLSLIHIYASPTLPFGRVSVVMLGAAVAFSLMVK